MTAEMIAADVPYFEGVAPMARVGQPHELRGAAVWLASGASSFCTGSQYVSLFFEVIRPSHFAWIDSVLVDGGITAW